MRSESGENIAEFCFRKTTPALKFREFREPSADLWEAPPTYSVLSCQLSICRKGDPGFHLKLTCRSHNRNNFSVTMCLL